jgi:hypothetical protein
VLRLKVCFLCAGLWLSASALAQEAPGLELDLSATADVGSVLVCPPVVKVTQSQGSFSGFNAAKVSEKFDAAAHKRLVAAFQKQLEGKVIPAEQSMGAVTQEVNPASIRTAAGLVKLAEATKVGWLVTFEFNKSGALVGSIYDNHGQAAGLPSYVNQAAGISQKHADDMAAFVAKQVIDLTAARQQAEANARAAALAAQEAAKPKEPEVVAPPEDDVALELAVRRNAQVGFRPAAESPRAVAMVGPGGVVRDFRVSGEASAGLAELKNNAVVGFGVGLSLSPLQWFAATAGKRFSGLDVEFHYRRALVFGAVKGGVADGQRCRMDDDDLMVRGTYRVAVANGAMAPRLGLAAGFTQEQTRFACDAEVVSTVWRGADAQLRWRQPLVTTLLSLDVAVGPRFLFASNGTRPGFSIGGEAWLEVKPVSVVFARAGARASRLVAQVQGLDVADTRLFFAVELGAFL